MYNKACDYHLLATIITLAPALLLPPNNPSHPFTMNTIVLVLIPPMLTILKDTHPLIIVVICLAVVHPLIANTLQPQTQPSYSQSFPQCQHSPTKSPNTWHHNSSEACSHNKSTVPTTASNVSHAQFALDNFSNMYMPERPSPQLLSQTMHDPTSSPCLPSKKLPAS